MIEVAGLTKRYGEHVAIDDVSFHVGRGEIVGLLGPNGSGKTTTLRILTGSTAPTSGRAQVCGEHVATNPIVVQRSIGYQPENLPLYLATTVSEYLHFIAALKGLPRRQRKDAVDGVMVQTGLTGVATRLLQNLSHGFRQRSALAQALLAAPPVLILDEPTQALDPRQAEEIRAVLRTLATDRTILLSTHLLHDVTATCSRALVLNRGRLVADVQLNGVDNLEQTFLRLTA